MGVYGCFLVTVKVYSCSVDLDLDNPDDFQLLTNNVIFLSRTRMFSYLSHCLIFLNNFII